jgi:hypothetical protein
MLRPVEPDWTAVRARHERLPRHEDARRLVPDGIPCLQASTYRLPSRERSFAYKGPGRVARRVRGRPPLRVQGIGTPRVAGASIMPSIVAGINAPSIMIGEKCVDRVRAAARLGVRTHHGRGIMGSSAASLAKYRHRLPAGTRHRRRARRAFGLRWSAVFPWSAGSHGLPSSRRCTAAGCFAAANACSGPPNRSNIRSRPAIRPGTR